MSYDKERAKNIAQNKALLESLGLDDLRDFAPAAASGIKITKPGRSKPKAATSKPKRAIKRKRSDMTDDEDDDDNDGDYKAPKLDEPDSDVSEDDPPHRSTRRRGGKRVNYNEDALEKQRSKSLTKTKSKGLGHDVLGRMNNRLGEREHNPKTFGAIPGIEVGAWWAGRPQCSKDAVHAPFVAGIYGNARDGAYSVALSGGYDDDVDLGVAFTYTGSGGRDLKGTKDKPKNLRTAPQSSDQTFENNFNAALKRSAETGKPVRVIRGYKLKSIYAPLTGYRYDGLYTVLKAWIEPGLKNAGNPEGYKVCKFAFKRLPGQPPIPERSLDGNGDEKDESNPESAKEPSEKTSPKASPPPSATEADEDVD